MNAQFPSRTAGSWNPVRHHQVIAAFVAGVATTMLAVGAVGIWQMATEDDSTAATPVVTTSTFDRIEYDLGKSFDSAVINDPKPAPMYPDSRNGVRGPVDSDPSVIGPLDSFIAPLIDEAPAEKVYPESRNGVRGPVDSDTVGAEHEALIGSSLTTEKVYPASRDGVRGPVAD